MKHFSRLFALVFVLSLTLTACGGGGSDLTAESKVDFSMSMADFDELDKSAKDKYEGKVVEISGTVKDTKQSHPADAQNGDWFIYLEGEGDGSFPPKTACYFSSDQAAHKGKAATVKGIVKFYDIADGAFLTNCFLTAK